jgi:hypothetical protein
MSLPLYSLGNLCNGINTLQNWGNRNFDVVCNFISTSCVAHNFNSPFEAINFEWTAYISELSYCPIVNQPLDCDLKASIFRFVFKKSKNLAWIQDPCGAKTKIENLWCFEMVLFFPGYFVLHFSCFVYFQKHRWRWEQICDIESSIPNVSHHCTCHFVFALTALFCHIKTKAASLIIDELCLKACIHLGLHYGIRLNFASFHFTRKCHSWDHKAR